MAKKEQSNTTHTKAANQSADDNTTTTQTVSQNESSETDTLRDQLVRLQAEFANYKRRTDEEKAQYINIGKEHVVKDLIEVIDNYELALKHADKLEDFKQGIEMVFAKLISSLEEQGLERIQSVGQTFDPREHEALLTEESDKPEQTILEELQGGYKLGSRVIRTAKVKVAKK
jgi:molecular chaperone GrpE